MRLRLPNVLVLGALLLSASGWWVDAQGQAKISRVGILTIEPPGDGHKKAYGAFYRTLVAQGWVEGRDVEFTCARTDGESSRFAEAASELVALKVDVIFADSAPAVRAGFAATRTIPIVASDFTTDPVAEGYAESYRRPGKNVTGVFLDAPEFSAKWLELLKSIVPGLSRAVVLWDPSPGDAHLRALQLAARSFGVQLQVVEVRTPQEIDRAASEFRGRPEALIVLPSPMTWRESARLAKLAITQRLHRLRRSLVCKRRNGVEIARQVGFVVVDSDLAACKQVQELLLTHLGEFTCLTQGQTILAIEHDGNLALELLRRQVTRVQVLLGDNDLHHQLRY
jgi:putative ABC transport system substrate-binding protein